MSANDTAQTESEAVPPADVDLLNGVDPFGGLDVGGLVGSLFPGMAELLADVNDPDRATIDDVAESLDELHEKADWLATVVVLAVSKMPAKMRPELPPYPSGS